MRSNLPAWLNPTSTQIGLERAVDQTGERLRMNLPVVWLTGHEALAVAGVAVRRVPGAVLGVRLAGCRNLSDAMLQLGWALDLSMPGRRADIIEALSDLVDTRIVVDCRGAGQAQINEFRQAVEHTALTSRWLMIIAPDHAPTNAISTGLSRSKRMGPDPTTLPAANHALGWLPAGIPGGGKGLAIFRVPGLSRLALWPEAAQYVRRRSNLKPAKIAEALTLLFDRHLTLAMDGLQPGGTVPADMFALRWIGQVSEDPINAGHATIAAARLMLRWGQPAEARSLIAAGLERGLCQGAPTIVRALLQWADARTCLEAGDPRTAALRFSDAAALLRTERALSLLACMTRRWGDALAGRGETARAARHYRDARALYRQAGDGPGVGATLRGAADVSVAAGEFVSAEALYDQVDASGGSAIELANLRLGQCVLALNRGEHHRARSLIEAAVRSAPHLPMMVANGARRRADLCLREGDHQQATRHALAARQSYAQCGASVASTRCIRLLGDIAAVGGRLKEAAGHYRDAMVAQIRIGDSLGLRLTLTHGALLEEFSGAGELAGELRRMLNKLDAFAPLS